MNWQVRQSERWVVLGPNGSGKTTLLRVLSLYQPASTGTVQVLGHTWGKSDIGAVRTRVGFSSASIQERFPLDVTATEVVLTGKHASLAPWWHTYRVADFDRAGALLVRMGCGELRNQDFSLLSSGEKQRVLLARSLMSSPDLLLLDEPAAGLDLGGREDLVRYLAALAQDPASPPCVLVTHHVEEIPPGFTHGLILSDGRVIAKGRLDDVITSDIMGLAFGCAVQVERRSGRFLCWSADR
jgi:iron complex transport system ATP-binding protein